MFMAKRIVIWGVLGGIVMFAVMLVCRLFLPGLGHQEFRILPGQVPIHAALKERITEPGTYICPYLPPEERNALFPNYLNEPIFAVTYRGYTHGTVPGFASPGILSFLLAPIAAAWLLSQASARVLATYARRAIFVGTLGVFVALAADLPQTLTTELPFADVAGMAIIGLITWAAVGLVLACGIKPISGRS